MEFLKVCFKVEMDCLISAAKENQMKKLLTWSCLIVLGISASVFGEEVPERSDREAKAAEKIRRLEQRVEDLERQLESQEQSSGQASASSSESDLEKRVDKLEKEMEEWNAADTLRAYWDEGLEWDSQDGRFHIEFGGRIMTDFAFWTSKDSHIEDLVNDGDDLEDWTEFRRARLFTSGKLYSNTVIYKAQYDFAEGDGDFKDVYIGFPKLLGDIGTVIVGHQKEPFSLEEQTSSKYMTFMERGLPNVFSPGRNTGFKVGNNVLNERVTWAVGVFDDAGDFGEDTGDGDWATTGRLTAAPWYADDGAKVLHLGMASSIRSLDDDETGFSSRPEMHEATKFVDTGDIMADEGTLLGLESALVYGPFSVQGEWIQAQIDTEDDPFFDDPEFDGYYVYVSYFLTGEHRAYDLGDGAFGRLKPHENAFEDGGLGAWEVGVRVSNVDLTDGLIMPAPDPFEPFEAPEEKTPGELDNIALGLNWYLNPNMRVMFNYVMADLDRAEVDDDVSAFLTRFQIDF